jgi:translation initiation factor IF-2
MTDNETKIVKAEKKETSGEKDKASKVQIRQVDIAILQAQKEKAAKEKAMKAAKAKQAQASKVQGTPTPAAPARKSPAGVAMPKSTAPVGKAMPKSSAVGKAMPKSAVPQKKADTPQPETPATESTAPVIETVEQVPATEAPKAEEKKVTIKIVKKAEETAEAAPSEEKKVKKTAKKAAEKETEPEKKTSRSSKKKEETETKAAEIKEAEIKEEKTDAKAVPEIKEEAPAEEKKTETAEVTKPETVEEKKAEEPEVYVDDFVPSIKIKIKRTAAQEAEEEAKRKAAAAEAKKAAKAQREKEKKESSKKNGDPRKPKEYVGKKKEGKSADSAAPRTKNAPGTAKGDKVVAFTAPSGGSQNGGKAKNKNDKKKNNADRDKFGSKFNDAPIDLSKKNKNKHSKYKETKVEEVEVVSEEVKEAMETGGVVINVPITLAGFCEQIEKPTSAAIMALMKMGIMANINQNLDEETAILLGMELGVTVAVKKVEEVEEEEGIDRSEDRESDLLPRAPIITVMGHVDHGKTSILDAIRKTNVTAGEAGGITQAIGASEVSHNGKRIVFLDTPGHEAFTAMRARGAHVTDIAVLVVAADDSVKPQTIESISHAKAAGVPIIVAINKIDKPGANLDLVKKDLADNGVLVEEWGGSTICVPVSAKTGQNIDQLLEMILLQAEMLELKANPNRMAQGTVIEARLDKNLGPVATLLVMNGTLHAGSAVVAGTACGRVRTMKNDKGATLKKAGPATAVEITGLTEVPESGDEFFMVRDDKTAREIAARRAEKLRADLMAKSSAISLEKLFSQIEEGEIKDLNIIIKADVQGSVEALQSSLEKLKNENVRVNIIHTGVGTVTEGDVMLAGTSNALIIGFNVRPSSALQSRADRDGVEIRCYRIIYEVIDDIEAAMKGMLNPVFKEVILGKAEVRNTFKVPNVGIIAGCYVLEGKMSRNAKLRLVRDGIVIHEGVVSSLKRFKDDAREVATGFECGLGIENYNDIKEGDIIEAFEMQEVERD